MNPYQNIFLPIVVAVKLDPAKVAHGLEGENKFDRVSTTRIILPAHPVVTLLVHLVGVITEIVPSNLPIHQLTQTVVQNPADDATVVNVVGKVLRISAYVALWAGVGDEGGGPIAAINFHPHAHRAEARIPRNKTYPGGDDGRIDPVGDH